MEKKKKKNPLKTKAFVLLICLPFYPIILIGEWYEGLSGFGYNPYSIIGQSAEYWGEVLSVLFDNSRIRSKGITFNRERLNAKRRKRFMKKVNALVIDASIKETIKGWNKQLKGTRLIFRLEETSSSYDAEVVFYSPYGFGSYDRYYGFLFEGDTIRFLKWDVNGWRKTELDAQESIETVYENEYEFMTKIVTEDEIEDVIARFTHTEESKWQA